VRWGGRGERRRREGSQQGNVVKFLRTLLLLIPAFSWDTAGDVGGVIILYNIIVLFICLHCGPRVGPTRSEALDTSTAALMGKSGG